METTAIDSEAFAAVKETMGDIFNEVIATFMGYVPQQISKLGDAIEQSDSELSFQLAHAIKSSSSSIGALGLARTAEQIELLGRASNLDGAGAHYQKLQQQYEEVADFLQNSISS